MVHNPGGDWHPGWGVDLTYITNIWVLNPKIGGG